MNYFVTAIGTDCGKTLASAILVQALQANYWKPVQAGLPRDTDTVMQLAHNERTKFLNESYLLRHPMSPHAAAALEGVHIDIDKIMIPEVNDDDYLVIEGAGGVLVPLNERHFVIELAHKLKAEIILVVNFYLGSINHTLLTINEIKKRNLPVKGIIFNGEPNPASEQIILAHSGYKVLLRIKPEQAISPEVVNRYALQLLEHFHEV